MIETLIAGLIVAAVMTAVGRLGISAMATSRNQSSRTSIEATINDHIQLVLTYKFEAPESTIGAEQRMIEVNPNFSSQCYRLS